MTTLNSQIYTRQWANHKTLHAVLAEHRSCALPTGGEVGCERAASAYPSSSCPRGDWTQMPTSATNSPHPRLSVNIHILPAACRH